MHGTPWRRVTALVCLSLLFGVLHPAAARTVAPDGPLEVPLTSGSGGRTMLVEEITATWCPSCAEIDPELVRVADSHGSRIALLALHPSDGEDAFQPPAAQHRIDRINAFREEAIRSTPTFVVEGGSAREGYEAWADVQRDILSTETQRTDVSRLSFTVEPDGERLRATVSNLSLRAVNDTQLTFMIIEHGKPVGDNAVNPGEPTRDRVVVGLAECSLSNHTITTAIGLVNATPSQHCESGFSVTFNATKHWSVVLVHEHALVNGSASSAQSLGAVELAYRPISTPTNDDLSGWVLLVCALVGAFALRRKV